MVRCTQPDEVDRYWKISNESAEIEAVGYVFENIAKHLQNSGEIRIRSAGCDDVSALKTSRCGAKSENARDLKNVENNEFGGFGDDYEIHIFTDYRHNIDLWDHRFPDQAVREVRGRGGHRYPVKKYQSGEIFGTKNLLKSMEYVWRRFPGRIEMHWVPGHEGVYENEVADKIAAEGSRYIQEQRQNEQKQKWGKVRAALDTKPADAAKLKSSQNTKSTTEPEPQKNLKSRILKIRSSRET